MALIVDLSLFYGDIEIPQISEPSVQSLLGRYIEKYEPLFLQQLFGYPLYKAIRDDYNNNVPRIEALKTGGEYTAYGYLRGYRGLKSVLIPGATPQYLSPIANYIYFYFYRDQQTASTGTGEKLLTAGSSINVAPWNKLMNAWNHMVDVNSELIDYIRYNYGTYPEYNVYAPTLLHKISLF